MKCISNQMIIPQNLSTVLRSQNLPYLRDTLFVLSSEKDGPGNTTGILALEEERLSLSILKSKDLAITTNIELALYPTQLASPSYINFNLLDSFVDSIIRHSVVAEFRFSYLSRVDLLAGEGIVVSTHYDYCVDNRRCFESQFGCYPGRSVGKTDVVDILTNNVNECSVGGDSLRSN